VSERRDASSRAGLCRLAARAQASLNRRTMPPPDPLHGVTLEKLLQELVAEFGWAELARRVPIRCFMFEPSITSSLRFLRKTPWARTKVEQIYVHWKTGHS
jgi:uncharacterized protein (DUF2132 family)